MCTSPKWIYKRGKYKKSNYRGAENSDYEIGMYAECGHCEQCMNKKSNNWVVRNDYEARAHGENACFVTLTYKEDPKILIRSDLTKFIKRLRYRINKENPEQKIRIWAAGEYGTLKGRPHFHLIIYGWTDKKARYLNINKKSNIIYQSDLIQRCWGLGRTSYNKAERHASIYTTLYTTPKEEFVKAYKITQRTANNLRKHLLTIQNEERRHELTREYEKIFKQYEEEKQKCMLIKEFNTWSIALGWEEFVKEYNSTEGEYVFTHYIDDRELPTPTPWLKKLANMGDFAAATEIFRRESLQFEQSESEAAEAAKNQAKMKKRIDRIREWAEEKTSLEEF